MKNTKLSLYVNSCFFLLFFSPVLCNPKSDLRATVKAHQREIKTLNKVKTNVSYCMI